MSSRTSIELPIHKPQEGDANTVELVFAELPGLTDLLLVLKHEKAALSIWLAVAEYYLESGNLADFRALLEAAVAADTTPEDRSLHRRNMCRVHALRCAYHLEEAKRSLDKEAKSKHLSDASVAYTKASSSDPGDPYALVCSAYCNLLMSEHSSERSLQTAEDRALTIFTSALTKKPNCVPAYLGRASIHFGRKRYAEALKDYRQVLLLRPQDCPANVRVGMGMCFARLKRKKEARAAFQRALHMDPNCTIAKVGLAILDLNEKTPETTINGMKLLKEVYQVDQQHQRHNAVVLNHLSEHFFHRGEYGKAVNLATHALNNSAVKEIKAESNFQLGRIRHAENNLEAAFKHYSQAINFNPEHVLALYGLGLMHIAKNRFDKAIENFKTLNDKLPNTYEVMKILAFLYKTSSSATLRDESRKLFRQVTELQPSDVENFVELALLLQEKAPDEALTVYERATQAITSVGSAVPAEIYNNMGVLHFQSGRFAQAMEAFEKAEEDCKTQSSGTDKSYLSGLLVTIAFNKARVLESTHRTEEAKNAYLSILRGTPSYVDCYLRLSVIARERGLLDEATDWCKEIFAYNQQHQDAWAMIGNLQIQQKQWGMAQKSFEKVLTATSSGSGSQHQDYYSLLGLANIFQYSGRFNHAEELYFKVLKYNDSNIYAVNGIGCVLAAQSKMAQAKDVFLQVREAAHDANSASQSWLNLAHTYVETGAYMEAVKLYKACLKRYPQGSETRVLTFLARALVKKGDYKEAESYVEKALHLDPTDERNHFNLALVQQQRARQIMEKDLLTMAQLDEAAGLLQNAMHAFQRLQTPNSKTKYDPQRASEEAQTCTDLHQQLVLRQSRVKQQEEQMLQKEAERKEHQRQLQQQKEQQKVEAAQKEKERQEQLRREVEEFQKLHADLALVAAAVEKKKKERVEKGGGGEDGEEDGGKKRGRARGGKRSKRKDDEDAPMLSDEDEPEAADEPETDEEGGAVPRRKKAKKARKGSAKTTKRMKRKLKSGDSDDEEEEDDGDTLAARKNRVKSKATVESDEEDEDMPAEETGGGNASQLLSDDEKNGEAEDGAGKIDEDNDDDDDGIVGTARTESQQPAAAAVGDADGDVELPTA